MTDGRTWLRPTDHLLVRLWRFFYQNLAGWTITAACAGAVLVLVGPAAGPRSRSRAIAVARFWARAIMRVGGVEFSAEGYEHVLGPRSCVVTMNHPSTLDTILAAALLPDWGTGLGKRQLASIPFMGLAMRRLDFLFLDRENPERANATLDVSAERMRSARVTVFIAPEGTRSKTGELQPFKLGAFRLAMSAGVPVVPMVIFGAHAIWPTGRLHMRPGQVRVRFLPPVVAEPGADATAFATTVREMYLRELGESDRARKED